MEKARKKKLSKGCVSCCNYSEPLFRLKLFVDFKRQKFIMWGLNQLNLYTLYLHPRFVSPNPTIR